MKLRSNPKGDPELPMPYIEGLTVDEAIPVIIAVLEKIDNRDEPVIYGMQGINTVNQLIKAIRTKSPQGLEMLSLWRRAEARIKEREGQKDGSPSFLSELRNKLGDALKKITGR